MERHPEEDDHGEDHDQRDDALAGLLRGQLHAGVALGGSLLGVDVGVLEPVAAEEVDGDGDDQRHAGHGEAHVVGRGQVLDVVGAEDRRIHGRHGGVGHHGLQLVETGGVVRADGAVEQLVRQGGDVGLVDEAGLAEEAVGDGRRGGRGEHRADVDRHVEQAERRIALGGIFRIVIQVAHHHLEVALEQARAHADEEQGADHQGHAQAVGGRRDGEGEVADEHHADAGDHALAETDLVGEPAADNGHEVDEGEENRVELAGGCLLPAELGLEEQHEDGQHGVVTKTLAGVGEG